MNDKQFEKVLGALRESYHRPPETPREELWQAILAELPRTEDPSVLSIDQGRARRWRVRSKGVRWAGGFAAAAALVAMGVGLGRMSTPGAQQVATAPETAPAPSGSAVNGFDPARSEAAFRFAAVTHLLKSESLLTMVRNDADAGRFDTAVGGWAGELLTETRLLMDSPATTDLAIAELLEDLELILVQLATLSGPEAGEGRAQAEMDLIARGMDQQEMLLRIQAVVPSGPALVGT